MSEEAYNQKVADLQRYIPFLENMITQLKDPKWKPREAQLNKMESLYHMITDTNKKWKYETLLKCEEVIIKLQTKVKGSRTMGGLEHHQTPGSQGVTHTVDEIMNALKFNNARAKLQKVQTNDETPKSPSPTPDAGLPHEPKIIPVEPTKSCKKFTNIIDPNELSTTWNQELEDRYTKERPDIYSSAAKSLCSKPPTIFERLGPAVSNKPLLTDDELAMLETGDDIPFELKDPESKTDEKSIDLDLKITPRVVPVPVPVPSSKPKTPKLESSSHNNSKAKDEKDGDKKTKEVKSKPVIAKSTCDIFGSLLSSIDDKILEEGNVKHHKKKKDDSKHHKDKDQKEHNKNHKDHHKDHKDHHKDHKDNKDHRHRKEKIEKESRRSSVSSVDSIEKELPKPEEAKTQEDQISSTVDIPVEKPVRLADKYQHKPKPKPLGEVESTFEEIRPQNRDPRRRSPPMALLPTPRLGPSPIPSLFDPRGQYPQPVPPPDVPIKPYQGIFGGIIQSSAPANQNFGRNQYDPHDAFEASPNRFEPTPNRFEPTPNRFEHTSNRFEPTPNRFEPAQNRFEPNRHDPRANRFEANRFEPAPNRFEQAPNRFEQAPNRFEQAPNRFDQNRFEPGPNRFEQAPNRFDQNRFEPGPNRFEHPSNRLEPPSNRFEPPNRHGQRTVPPLMANFEPKHVPHRKSFNPFEPLDGDKDEITQAPQSRDLGYSRGGFQRGGSRYERGGRYDRSRPRHEDRFDHRSWRSKSRDPRYEERPREEVEIKQEPEETFTSPLECLYSNPRPAVKGAMQNFKIPKKVKPEEKKVEVLKEDGQKSKDDGQKSKEDVQKSKDDGQKSKDNSGQRKKETRREEDGQNRKDDDEDLPVPSRRRTRIKVLDDSDNEAESEDNSTDRFDKLKRDLKTTEGVKKTTEDAKKTTEDVKKTTEDVKKIVEDVKKTTDDVKKPTGDVKKPTGDVKKTTGDVKKTPEEVKIIQEEAAIGETKTDELVEPEKEEVPKVTSSSETSGTTDQEEAVPKTGRRRPVRAARAKAAAKPVVVQPEAKQEEEESPKRVLRSRTKLTSSSESSLSTSETKIELPSPPKRRSRAAAAKIEEKAVETEKKIKAEDETKPKVEEQKVEAIPKMKDEDVKIEDSAGGSKVVEVTNQIQKARKELLEEVKNENLSLDDQGVLQFILKNYKKIKKIFKSDSSSDEEGDGKKKKKKEQEEETKLEEDIPKDKAEMPKEKAEALKEKAEASKEKAEAPKEKVEASKVKTETPKDKTETPKEKIEAPEEKTMVEPEEPEALEVVQKAPKKVQTRNVTVVATRGRKKKLGAKTRVTRRSLKASPVKKARRSELDKLHDDIKEMLMGGEIMSKSGKRTCTMVQKDENEESKESKEGKEGLKEAKEGSRESKEGSKEAKDVKEAKEVKEATKEEPLIKTNLRVILEKTDFQSHAEDSNDGPPLLEMVSPERKRVLKRKKNNRWATGFIQKKPKRKLSTTTVPQENEDLDEDEVLIQEHEKSYCFNGALKYDCRLCNFKGRLIVHHYKNSHSDSEVLISRLQPKIADDIIRDAIERVEEYSAPIEPTKKVKSVYNCPFCSGNIKENQENFYYHLTSHTGEYRFACSMCPFRTSTSKCVRVHLSQTHNKPHMNKVKSLYPAPVIGKHIFGFLCAVCNFIQLSFDLVEEHSMVYHPGTPQIYKVNLASVIQKETVDLPNEISSDQIKPPVLVVDTLMESIDAVARGLTREEPEKIVRGTVKDLNVFDLMSQMQNDDAEFEEDLEEEEEGEPPTPVQLAAFMVDTDLNMEDEHKKEHEKRLLKMKEINENFKPVRTSMADKLQIKLVSEEHKIAEEPTMEQELEKQELQKQELEKQELERQQLENQELEKSLTQIPSLILIEKPKKPETQFVKVDVMPQKKDNCVSSIINRLQEKLLPPLLPFGNKQSQPSLEPLDNPLDNILEIGPIRVTRKPNSCTFNCKIPHCVFTTDDEKVFSTHCAVTHKDFAYVFKQAGKCDICTVKFEYDGDFVSVYDVYIHMKTCHREFFEGVEGSMGWTAVPALPTTPKSDVFSMPHDVPNLLSNTPDRSGPKFPFVITSVTSLATQRKTYPPSPRKEPTIIIKQSSPDQLSILKPPNVQIQTISTLQPIAPPKLQDPVSPIRLSISPEGAPTQEGQKRRLILRDIPLRDDEKGPRKSPYALAILLQKLNNNNLYKCPKLTCIFTTMHALLFKKHLGQHMNLMKTLVPCLYCDYKVFYGYYIVHLEVRHGHCLFGCAYCFYRTTCKYFVQRHQNDEHPNFVEDILYLNVNTYSNKATNEQPLPALKEVMGNYSCKCIQGNTCEFQSGFFDEYLIHQRDKHGLVDVDEQILTSWIGKGVGPFQCRYCKKATMTYDEMGSHQAKMHSLKQCLFYYRKFVPTFNAKFPEDLCYENDEHFEHMIKLPDQQELYDSYTSKPPSKTTNIWPQYPEIVSDDSTEREINEQLSALSDRLASFDELEVPTADIDEVDPLSLDFPSGSDSFLEESGDQSGDQSFEEGAMPAAQAELCGRDLYKCNCGGSYDTFETMRAHRVVCLSRPFRCVHCGKEKKTAMALAHHYKEHGRKRFKCSLCVFKHWQQEGVRAHMRQVHSVTSTIILPAVLTSKKVNPDLEDFVLRPRQTAKSITEYNINVKNVTAGNAHVIEEPSVKVYGPNEIAKLPRQPIYPTAVKCAICAFETKVKSNMERHLQMHAKQEEVPGSAPVNPVPCLEKSEKMFDKMVNLALSSHTTGRMGGVPAKSEKPKEDDDVPCFVPLNNRFICGSDNCRYQCPEESMLRRHLIAFHSQDTTYKCVHCNANIQEEKTINIDLVLKHLKLHDAHLYQCGTCKFVHNLRHKVERHLSDKHPDNPQALIVIRELAKKDNNGENEVSFEKEQPREVKSWRCGICKFRCADEIEVKSHVSSKHNVDAKYTCALCPSKSDNVEDFTKHFNAEHEEQNVDFIVTYYKEEEAKAVKENTEIEFNTTPLWQRNSKTVKHIRGILLEEARTTLRKKLKVRRFDAEEEKVAEEVTSPKMEVVKRRKKSVTPAKATEHRKSSSDVEFVPIDNTPILIEDDDGDPLEGKKKDENDDKKLDKPPKEKSRISIKNITILRLPKMDDLVKNLEKPITEPIEKLGIDDIIAEALDNTPEEEQRPQRSAKLQAASRIAISTEEPDSTEQPKKAKKSRKSKADRIESPLLLVDESSSGSKRSTPDPLGDAADLIEILDEEETVGQKRKRPRIDLTLKEIGKMGKTQLLEGNFIGTYGPYGSPWEGRYKCPLCENFMSTSEKEFTHHLYQEPALQLPFMCNSCKFTAVTQDLMEEHVKSSHDSDSDVGYKQLHLDKQIEGWIHKLITFQTRILNLEKEERKNDPQNETESEINKIINSLEGYMFVCKFCDYGCNYNSDLRKHEPRHLVEKPFTCGYCPYDAMYRPVVLKHLRRMHRDQPERIKEADVSDGVLIHPYLKKKSNDAPKNRKTTPETTSNEPDAEHLKCYYCEYRGTIDQQTSHMKTDHPEEIVRIFRYRCNHCSESFVSLVTLNNHFFNDHAGLEHSFTSLDVQPKCSAKYGCVKCNFRDNKLEEMQTHVRSHFMLFRCPYCSCQYPAWRDAVEHVEDKHADKPVVLKYMIRLEEEIEEIMNRISGKITNYIRPLRLYPRKRKAEGESTVSVTPPPLVETLDLTSSPQTQSATVFTIDDDSP